MTDNKPGGNLRCKCCYTSTIQELELIDTLLDKGVHHQEIIDAFPHLDLSNDNIRNHKKHYSIPDKRQDIITYKLAQIKPDYAKATAEEIISLMRDKLVMLVGESSELLADYIGKVKREEKPTKDLGELTRVFSTLLDSLTTVSGLRKVLETDAAINHLTKEGYIIGLKSKDGVVAKLDRREHNPQGDRSKDAA